MIFLPSENRTGYINNPERKCTIVTKKIHDLQATACYTDTRRILEFYMKTTDVLKEIENIKNQLIEKYKPEKIILIGSAAWGNGETKTGQKTGRFYFPSFLSFLWPFSVDLRR